MLKRFWPEVFVLVALFVWATFSFGQALPQPKQPTVGGCGASGGLFHRTVDRIVHRERVNLLPAQPVRSFFHRVRVRGWRFGGC